MPPIEAVEPTVEPKETKEDQQAQDDSEETPVAKPTIGIIYPPPEVRNIVDKTASFVARNGPEFETRIRQNEVNNPKFNFLNTNDPYNSYYKHKVKEFIEGKAQDPQISSKNQLGYMPQKPAAPTAVNNQQLKIIEKTFVIKDPPPEFEFIAEAPSISAFDLDVVKLTAQFVARNGRQFLTNLMNREQRNYQFDFLRPQHSLFSYFSKLVEQYTKILLPQKDLLGKLSKETDDPKNIYNQVMYRVEWMKYQEREKRREEDEKEKERVAYAQIDWHDFVVVEVVNFQVNETGNFPPPTTPDEIGARLIHQERYVEPEDDNLPPPPSYSSVINQSEMSEEQAKNNLEELNKLNFNDNNADTNVQDMEEDSDEEAPPKLPEHPPAPSQIPSISHLGPPIPNPVIKMDKVIIRDYDPKAKFPDLGFTGAPEKYLISPITGERIPADKIQEHMRIGLLDPKWKEQTEKLIQERREQDEVYAAGSSIASHLKQLTERRTDIFGSGNEETMIGKKIGEEERKDKNTKIIWDGHSMSMEKVTQKARENITIEDQIAVIHRNKGLVVDDEKEKIGPTMPKNVTMATPMSQMTKTVPPPQPAPPVLPPQGAPSSKPDESPSLPPQPMPQTNSIPTHNLPSQSLPINPSIPRPSLPISPIPNLIPRPPMVPRPNLNLMASLGNMVLMGQAVQNSGMLPINRTPFLQGPALLPSSLLIPKHPPQNPNLPQPAPPEDEGPMAKKSKTEAQLIPEHIFIANNISPVEFKVHVPSMEKSDWNLNGQITSISLPLTDTVSVIKAKIFDELGMPAGKQKLQLEGMFLKDSNTLAFYNITASSVVQLQLKERGGRKK